MVSKVKLIFLCFSLLFLFFFLVKKPTTMNIIYYFSSKEKDGNRELTCMCVCVCIFKTLDGGGSASQLRSPRSPCWRKEQGEAGLEPGQAQD